MEEKISPAHRRQPYSRKKKIIPVAVFIMCYVWFAWQLYVSPWYMAAIAVGLPGVAFVAALVRRRFHVLPIAGMHEAA